MSADNGKEVAIEYETKKERAQRLGTKKTLPEECRVRLEGGWTFQELEKELRQAADSFQKHGVLVLENFLNTAQVEIFTKIFREWYEDTAVRKPDFLTTYFPMKETEDILDYEERVKAYAGYKFDDPSTHKHSQLTALHGIIKNYGIGQSECMWYLRTLPSVIWLFTILHGTDELFTSFDGVCFQNHTGKEENGKRNPLETGKPKGGWIHQDLDPKLGRLGQFGHHFGIQCQFTMTTGHHLRAVTGVHNSDFTNYAEKETNGSTHWFKPTVTEGSTERPKYFRNKDSVVVEAPAGSAILWFSSTPHAGTNLDLERLTAYVCMRPKAHLRKDPSRKGLRAKKDYYSGDVKRIKEAIENDRTTNHWGTRLNSVLPQHYGIPLKNAENLITRLPGSTIWKQKYANSDTLSAFEILTLESEKGLTGGYEKDPVIHTHSLREGKALIKRYARKF